MSKSKATLAAEASDREHAVKVLRDIFPVGSTVSTSLQHCSRSGMYRVITVLVGGADGSVRDVSSLVAKATGSKFDTRHYGVGMGGCGADMGYMLVYSLARALYRDGFPCTGEGPGWTEGRTRCPSNDHVNSGPERDNYTPGHLHSDPGYALGHRWI